MGVNRLRSAAGLPSVGQLALYRGKYGQLLWILHRLAGLGVVAFLLLHVVDTATVYFMPSAYNFFLAIYKNPVFGVAEILLGAALAYHAVNGLRVTIMDFAPQLWPDEPFARWFVLVGFLVLFVPAGTVQAIHIVRAMLH